MKFILTILLCFIGIQAKSFDSKLKAYLDEKLKNYEKYEYRVLREPKGYTKIEINDEKSFRLAKNYAYVPIKYLDSERKENYSVLTVRVKLYKTVLVAVQNIDRNTNLSPVHFERELKEISELDGRLADEETAGLSRSKVFIKTGSILLKEMIELIPVINSGDKVVLHSGKNGVDIAVDVISRQDGCVGDVISVQSNNKIYKAKVIDKFNLTLVE